MGKSRIRYLKGLISCEYKELIKSLSVHLLTFMLSLFIYRYKEKSEFLFFFVVLKFLLKLAPIELALE